MVCVGEWIIFFVGGWVSVCNVLVDQESEPREAGRAFDDDRHSLEEATATARRAITARRVACT